MNFIKHRGKKTLLIACTIAATVLTVGHIVVGSPLIITGILATAAAAGIFVTIKTWNK